MTQIASGKSGSSVAQNLADVVEPPAEYDGNSPVTPAADRRRRSGAEPPQGGGLGTPANNSSAVVGTDFFTDSHRAERFRLRRVAASFERERWEIAGAAHPVNSCGHAREDVGIRRTENGQSVSVGLAGSITCGSVWVCPVCAHKIGRQRNEEVGHVLGWARAQRKSLGFLTLTVRHNSGQRLRDVWNAVSTGWAEVTSGAAWQSETREAFAERLQRWYEQGKQADADKKAGLKVSEGGQRAPRGWTQNKVPQRRIGDQETYGIEGWIRVTEVTHGKNGWHVHVHVPLILDAELSRDQFNKLEGRIWKRWQKGIGKAGFTAEKKHGIDLEPFTEAAAQKLEDYLTKATSPEKKAEITAGVEKKGRDIAREVTGSTMKTGRGASRTPWQILDDSEEDTASRLIWLDWVRDSQGRRQLAWSKGLREKAGLEREKSDEEIAAEALGNNRDTVVTVEKKTWNKQCVPVAATILDAAQASPAKLRELLVAQGIEYRDGPAESEDELIARLDERFTRTDDQAESWERIKAREDRRRKIKRTRIQFNAGHWKLRKKYASVTDTPARMVS